MQGISANECERPLSDDLLDGAQKAAEFIGISRSQVYRLTERNLIPFCRLGGRLYYSKEALRAVFRVAA